MDPYDGVKLDDLKHGLLEGYRMPKPDRCSEP